MNLDLLIEKVTLKSLIPGFLVTLKLNS